MDLSSLQATLGVRDERPSDDFVEPDTDGPSVVDEIFARHRNSTQPESQQLRLILTSVLEVISAEGLQPTPTALFAAVMSSLQRPETISNPEVTAAMCNLLSAILGRVPTSILRSRAVQTGQVLVSVIEHSGTKGAVAKAGVPCLCQLLAAMGPTDWPALSRGFGIIITTCLDHQPKLRKKAQSGLVDILAALQTVPTALAPASEAVLKLSQKVLPGPQAAAQAAAAASSRKRQQAEEAITASVADALHLMGALKHCISLLSGSSAQGICELLLRLYPLRQPLLTRHTTDTLAALCASSASHMSPRALSDLLSAVLLSEDSWDKRDASSSLAMTRLLEEGVLKLAAADPALSAAVLPRIVHVLVPQLASHQEGVRRSTTMALKNIINAGLQESEVASAVAAVAAAAGNGSSKKGGTRNKMSSVQRIVSAVESALGPQYRDAWEGSLSVAGELLEKLGTSPQAAELATGLVLRIGQLCAGADDLAATAVDNDDEDGDEQQDEEARLTMAAQTTLGVALRALGPEAVLYVLPLQLVEGLEGTDEARTWLLPLLRTHIRNTNVDYWHKALLPLARAMGSRAAAAGKNSARQQEAQVCLTLEAQIWATLPSFCSWAEDIGNAFPSLSKAIAPAFEKLSDLRTPICNALRRLASQSRQAMRYHGQTIGHADPTVTMEESENTKHSSSLEEDLIAEEEHDTVPTTITLETAQNAVQVLQKDAETWLPLLLNSFVTTPANQRGHIGAAVAAYACICDPSSIATLFRAAIIKLMKVQEQMRSGELGRDAVFEGGESDTERVCTFMEAALLLAGGLDVAGIQVLWKAAIPGTKEKDPAIQKKSYKIIAYLCESRQDFVLPHFADVLRILLEGTGTAVSAAKRYRLRCLKASILELVTWEGEALDLSSLPGLHNDGGNFKYGVGAGGSSGARLVITPMVTEIILCVKEANKRTRAAAFDLLIEVATAMHEAEPPTINVNDNDDEELAASASAQGGGLHSLVTIVLGGLIGSTPHMISASVMALARLLFEFAPVLAGLVPALLPSVLLLLRSKAREVIKAVLGFVKVVVMRLPTAELLKFTPAICEGILLWAEDSKNKFRLKVRVILERIARRCGFEALETAVPEAHRALLTHIRKQHHRKERKKNSGGATEMDWNGAGVDGDNDQEDGRSRKSKAGTARTARTAAKSAWNSEMFSDEEDDDDLGLRGGGGGGGAGGRSDGGKTLRSVGGKSGVTGSRSVRSAAHQAGGNINGRRLPSSGSGDDPVDLLDAGIARKMVRGGVIGGGGGGSGSKKISAKDIDFETNKDGRMVIREEVPLIGKRKRNNNDAADAGFDSGDSDFEDLKGYSGLALALKGSKSVAQAQSIAASLGGKSLGAKSMGARSMGGRSQRTSATAASDGKQNRRGGQHSGDRFKAKKSGAGGDVKGSSKVEPYAYWPLDRKMLNRRVQKTKTAKSGLDRVVSAAKAGTAKGQKAKRARN